MNRFRKGGREREREREGIAGGRVTERGLEVCVSVPKVKKITEKTLIGMAFRVPFYM